MKVMNWTLPAKILVQKNFAMKIVSQATQFVTENVRAIHLLNITIPVQSQQGEIIPFHSIFIFAKKKF